MERRTWGRSDILIIIIVQLIACLSSVTAQDYYRNPDTNRCSIVIESTPLNWYNARDYCQTLSGELAKITTMDDQLFYDALLVGTTMTYWTQVNDLASEGVYVYLDGQNVTYTNWMPGQPDQNPDEHCVRITAYIGWRNPPTWFDSAMWTDKNCSLSFAFICDVAVNLVNETCLNVDNLVYPNTTTVEPTTTTVEPTTTTVEPGTTTVEPTTTTVEPTTTTVEPDTTTVEPTTTTVEPDTTTVEPNTDPPTTTEEIIMTTEPFTIRNIVPTPAASEQGALTAVAAVAFIGVPLIVGSLIVCRYCGFLAGCKRRKRSVEDEPRPNEDEA